MRAPAGPLADEGNLDNGDNPMCGVLVLWLVALAAVILAEGVLGRRR